MSSNTLQGKTLFITGASRGIGHAIALRAAADGANIAIIAKTTVPHPKLPGTIYSAAEDVEKAGGKALALAVDIRDDAAVFDAVKQTVERFGGIDICVNNASAISLTGTLETPMKRYDLMNQINARGTYLCSQACLPYLLKSNNAHILNLSPPLNMEARWFQNHTAYTMAKFGMSMCVLGMAAEFREHKVAVNALWPRTAIATAAVQNLLGGDAAIQGCRKPSIMADAAHAIFITENCALTGSFLIDEDFLRTRGVSDFEQYAVTPEAPLFPDYFI